MTICCRWHSTDSAS